VLSPVLLLTAVLQGESPAPDTTSRAKLTVLPVVSYSEVTGVQYGGTLFRSFRVGHDAVTRGSSFAVYAARTAEGHSKAHVQLDRWSQRNDMRTRFRIEYISYPLPYFGTGRESPDSAELWFSSGATTVHLFHEWRWRGPLYLHTGTRITRTLVREIGPALDPSITPSPPPGNSVLYSGVFGVVVDSRDNAGSPRSGSYVRALPSFTWHADSDAVLNRLTIDARGYRRIFGTRVIAAQVQYDGTSSDWPVDYLPMIGADTAMRGYDRGRYRDRQALTVQAEFRTEHRRRVGAVAFAGAGTVAPTLGRLASGAWYPTVGAGVRYVLSPRDRTVVRADFGIGRGSFGLSVGIGEAF
jgi:outer membrane protein assembly factor BamA